MKRILVIGGYGGFGATISRLLGERGFHVIVAGRNLGKAEAFCAAQDSGVFEAATVDRLALDSGAIKAFHVWAVVDAAGPWQGQENALPRACIAAGCHYGDIADARDFVGDIGALDEAAKAAGVVAIAGASSAPALTSAVCDTLSADLDRVTTIDICLSASNRSTGSQSITAAVLSYAGKQIALWRGGKWRQGYGWLAMRRETFDAGGKPYRRLVGLCDVPDHDILPARYRGKPATVFRAGTESWLQNRAIWLTAWLVRLKLLPNGLWMSRPARLAQWAMGKFGGERSAMSITLTGWRDDQAIRKRWEVLAEKGDGPSIPCLAIPIVMEKMRGSTLEPGARDAAGSAKLTEYDTMFAPLAITHTTIETSHSPLYVRVMGEDYERLPSPIRAMHQVAGELTAQGRATIKRSRNPIARLIGWLFRFPAAGDDVPLQVWMEERGGVEVWHRDFDGQKMRSELSQHGDFLIERFGLLSFGFKLRATPDGLLMDIMRWWIGPVPMPLALGPKSAAREFIHNARFHLDVPISLPLIGMIVHYRGWLEPDSIQ